MLPGRDLTGLIASSRRGATFNAHSYPTKIDASAILRCILQHTLPGDTVLDPFAGSGSTGIAATLAGSAAASQSAGLGPEIADGERNAVLVDVSALGTFIAETLANPPSRREFLAAANELLDDLESEFGWMYEAVDPDGVRGQIRHIIWTEFIRCPGCGTEQSFFASAVKRTPPAISENATCSVCRRSFRTSGTPRITESYYDDILGRRICTRKRRPALVYGSTGTRNWSRAANADDERLVRRIRRRACLPQSIPVRAMMDNPEGKWGEMHRTGYHVGITHVHHFYTRRNLIAIGAAWEAAEPYPEHIRRALRFWISSFNATHSTLMTRIVCKKGAKDFVLSGSQPGALYVGSLPVEKNVLLGLRRKLRTIDAAFEIGRHRSNLIKVQRRSATAIDLPDASVDYAFADPPFGGNIQYAEVNFISEAWLGTITDMREEIVVSAHHGRSTQDYERLLSSALAEVHRVLKPGGKLTLAFHSTSPDVWNAVRSAWESAGFEVLGSAILDKEQTSFKQTTTRGAVWKDPLFLLGKRSSAFRPCERISDLWKLIDDRIQFLVDNAMLPQLRDKHHLFSFLVSELMARGESLPLTAQEFFTQLLARYPSRRGAYLPRLRRAV